MHLHARGESPRAGQRTASKQKLATLAESVIILARLLELCAAIGAFQFMRSGARAQKHEMLIAMPPKKDETRAPWQSRNASVCQHLCRHLVASLRPGRPHDAPERGHGA